MSYLLYVQVKITPIKLINLLILPLANLDMSNLTQPYKKDYHSFSQSSIIDAQERLQAVSASLYSMNQTEILKEITDTGVMMSGYMMMYYYEMYTPPEVRDEVVRRMNALNTGELREYSRNQMIKVC